NYMGTESNLMNTEQLLERMKYMTEVVFLAADERTQATQQRMISKFNASVKHNEFSVGTIVMSLDPIQGGKLTPKYEGPFTVAVLAEAIDPNAYVVGKILEHRPPKPDKGRIEYEYHVPWKGYGAKDDTWEPCSNLFVTECICDYWTKKGKLSPHLVTTMTVATSQERSP
ncbi:hypothetical protein BGX27_009690, partial [Mortierella sp. AM989]